LLHQTGLLEMNRFLSVSAADNIGLLGAHLDHRAISPLFQATLRRNADMTEHPMRALLALLALLGALSVFASPAAAQYPCGGAVGPGEIIVGMSDGSTGVAPFPLCARAPDSSAPSVTQPVQPPPRYIPPPPPKGWQPRHTSVISFIVRRDEDDTPHYVYRIASNFPSAAEARSAVIQLCAKDIAFKFRSDDTPGNRISYCKGSEAWINSAYYSVALEQNGRLGSSYSDHRYDLVRYNNGNALQSGEKIFFCADTSLGLPGCNETLLAIGANGIFSQPNVKPVQIAPCESAQPAPGQAIIGVDRATGIDRPLCGPDPEAFLIADRKGLFEGLARHPRYTDFWAVGGFRDPARAEAEAVRLCNQRTGGGCVALGHASDGVLAILRRDDGTLLLQTGADSNQAIAAGRRACDANQILTCKLVATRVTGTIKPRMASASKNSYAAAVIFSGHPQAVPTVWAARDFVSRDAAEDAALIRCRSDNGGRPGCRVAASVLGGAIFVFDLPGAKVEAVAVQKSEIDGEGKHRYDAIVEAFCRRQAEGCRSRGSYSPNSGDSLNPRVELF
jgi:hypothetical protein